MAHRRKQGLTLATNLMVWTWDSGTCRLPPQILQSDWAPFTVTNSLQNAASKETCLGQAMQGQDCATLPPAFPLFSSPIKATRGKEHKLHC